jgi:hypothetical protein
VVLATIRGEKALAEQFDVHANQIAQRKSQGPEGAAGVFGETLAAVVRNQGRLLTNRQR